jgi:diguanylate cyclase (GGDEF)-like protein
MTARNFDFGPYAQILKALIPRARVASLYAADGEFMASSDGTEPSDLRSFVDQLLEQATQPAYLDQTGRLEVLEDTPLYLFLLRDEVGSVLGVVGLVCKPSATPGEFTPFANVERPALPVLSLLRRDLEQRHVIETGRFNINESVDLQWLVEATQIQAPAGVRGDPLGSLLEALANRIQCDYSLLYSPGRGLERLHSRTTEALVKTELLHGIARKHLFRMAETQQQTLIINKIRETAGEIVPFRILCVPLKRRGSIIGIVVAFNHSSRRPFETRDARMLERLCPRFGELIEVRYDEATGLLSRQAFEEESSLLLGRSRDLPRCVVYGDLDRLHAVNDLFGFASGDEVLRRVARLWQTERLPEHSLVSRVAGDRFVALLENCTLNQGRVWAEQLCSAIEHVEPPSGCVGIRITASLGVVALQPGTTLEHALAAAETACKAAKDRGRNRVELFADTDLSLMQRHEDLRVFRDLVEALDQSRFQLFAQPIVPLWDPTRARRFEILVRLLDENDEPVAPEKFFSAATRYQLMPKLDRWVVEQTLACLAPHRQWLESTGFMFAVNLSGQSLGQEDFADFVRTAVKGSGLPPALVGFEITESAAISHLDAAKRFIERLSDLGCSFSLDDFGTGLSSLAYLKDLAVSTLKIDGAFIRELLTDPRSESMVRAVLEIARQLGLETVAEYVETPQASAHLAKLGVTYGQGYVYARPQPLADMLAELSKVPATAAAGAAVRIAAGPVTRH